MCKLVLDDWDTLIEQSVGKSFFDSQLILMTALMHADTSYMFTATHVAYTLATV